MPLAEERVSFRDTVASVALDGTRGLAALLVLLDHSNNLFFVNTETALQSSSHPLVIHAFYLVRGVGPGAVAVFFVLSGYLISGSVFRSLEEGRWSWKDYLTHRCVRLWLVLLPSLLLCAIWDSARLAWIGNAASHGATFAARMAAAGLTWKTLLGNIFFLQTIRTAMFGSNRVLWSLAAEFWYYILFPLGLLAWRPGSPVRRILYAAGFVVVAVFVGRGVGILGLFPVWLCGTALAMVRPPRVGGMARFATVLLYVPIMFTIANAPWPWRYFKPDYLLGPLTAIMLWVMLSAKQRAKEEQFGVRLLRALAAFSYSLYLVHYPFLAFCAVVLTHGTPWVPTIRTLSLTALCGAVAALYGYGVGSVTEFRNERVRRWVERVLSGRRYPVVCPGSVAVDN